MNLNLFPLCLALAGILIASTLQAQHAKSIPTDISDEIVSGVSFELATQRKSAISEVEYDLSFDYRKRLSRSPHRFRFDSFSPIPTTRLYWISTLPKPTSNRYRSRRLTRPTSWNNLNKRRLTRSKRDTSFCRPASSKRASMKSRSNLLPATNR